MTQEPNEFDELQVGDRVKLSELGRVKMPRRMVGEGTVISVISGLRVSVLFDGRRTKTTLARSYLNRA